MVYFGYDDVIKSDSVCTINVRLMGEPKDYDRPIRFEMIDTASTAKQGADVELLPDKSFIPAGKNLGVVALKLKNTSDLNDTTLMVKIRLLANEYFQVNYTQTINADINTAGKMIATEYRLFFNNSSDMPNLWADFSSRFTNYWGTFSKVKLDVICEVCHVDRSLFEYDPQTQKASTVWGQRFPMAILQNMCTAVNRYLDNWKATHDGNPLTDEKGNVVQLGKYAQNWK
jgi:hypothetical protein